MYHPRNRCRLRQEEDQGQNLRHYTNKGSGQSKDWKAVASEIRRKPKECGDLEAKSRMCSREKGMLSGAKTLTGQAKWGLRLEH